MAAHINAFDELNGVWHAALSCAGVTSLLEDGKLLTAEDQVSLSASTRYFATELSYGFLTHRRMANLMNGSLSISFEICRRTRCSWTVTGGKSASKSSS
eukprot:SAG31_NODE_535_length_14348_cov_11.339603_6_plen_99_part_00